MSVTVDRSLNRLFSQLHDERADTFNAADYDRKSACQMILMGWNQG